MGAIDAVSIFRARAVRGRLTGRGVLSAVHAMTAGDYGQVLCFLGVVFVTLVYLGTFF
jgi:hypothetical protein